MQVVTGTEEEENKTLLLCLEKPPKAFSLKSDSSLTDTLQWPPQLPSTKCFHWIPLFFLFFTESVCVFCPLSWSTRIPRSFA